MLALPSRGPKLPDLECAALLSLPPLADCPVWMLICLGCCSHGTTVLPIGVARCKVGSCGLPPAAAPPTALTFGDGGIASPSLGVLAPLARPPPIAGLSRGAGEFIMGTGLGFAGMTVGGAGGGVSREGIGTWGTAPEWASCCSAISSYRKPRNDGAGAGADTAASGGGCQFEVAQANKILCRSATQSSRADAKLLSVATRGRQAIGRDLYSDEAATDTAAALLATCAWSSSGRHRKLAVRDGLRPDPAFFGRGRKIRTVLCTLDT